METTTTPFEFNYILGDCGWSTLDVTIDDRRYSFCVSFLNDSLQQLASAIRALLIHGGQETVVFIDEPGEFHLNLDQLNEEYIEILGRWHPRLYSMGTGREKDFQFIFTHKIGLHYFAKLVLQDLDLMYKQYGTKEYADRWVNHPFPYKEYELLKTLLP